VLFKSESAVSMPRVKSSFVLYAMFVACLGLCSVTHFLVINTYKITPLTYAYCNKHAYQTELWVLVQFQKRLITHRYEFFKEITIRHNQWCQVNTLWGSMLECYYNKDLQYLCVVTTYKTERYQWVVQRNERGECDFCGYTRSYK
jgi:hypothetical protein